MRPLPRAFYARSALRVAPDLLGRLLVRDGPGGRVSGRIVEVEAYRGRRDPASHAFRGRTARNATMFGRPGHLYVYFTYGMHHCINVVCEDDARPGAVLVRALAPVEGLVRMRERRGTVEDRRLARGPGCVARALGLDRRHDGLDLVAGPVWIADGPAERGGRRVARGPRIGIRAALDRAWRFWLEGHPCVSSGRTARREGARG
jgi:DNA-3-methyladenine glycosylase